MKVLKYKDDQAWWKKYMGRGAHPEWQCKQQGRKKVKKKKSRRLAVVGLGGAAVL